MLRIVQIKKPLITEKSMKLASLSCYTFMVDHQASKVAIAKAIKERFAVDVIEVKTLNVKAHKKRQRKFNKLYKVAGFKKALVQLKKGQTIALFETPKEQEVEVTTEQEPRVVKEKKNIFRDTKVRIEKGTTGERVITPRKVIPT